MNNSPVCDAPLVALARGDLFGAEFATYMKRAARGLTHLTIFGEDLPNVENRVELVSDKDDEDGKACPLLSNW